jgi:hypothetical protein
MHYGILNREESSIPLGRFLLSESLFSALSDTTSDIAGCDATERFNIKTTNTEVDRILFSIIPGRE